MINTTQLLKIFMVLISTSILSADFLNLNQEITKLNTTNTDFLHIDIMDGHFVPNISFGPEITKMIKSKTNIPLDVHLMTLNPGHNLNEWIKAGADMITFHYETIMHHHYLINQIKALGAKVGIAINPGTNIQLIEYLLPFLDLVLIMSVNPGYGGQKFIPECSLPKIKILKQMIINHNLSEKLKISVDGGVDNNNAKFLIEAGANILVAGSYITKAENGNYQERINLLRY